MKIESKAELAASKKLLIDTLKSEQLESFPASLTDVNSFRCTPSRMLLVQLFIEIFEEAKTKIEHPKMTMQLTHKPLNWLEEDEYGQRHLSVFEVRNSLSEPAAELARKILDEVIENAMEE